MIRRIFEADKLIQTQILKPRLTCASQSSQKSKHQRLKKVSWSIENYGVSGCLLGEAF